MRGSSSSDLAMTNQRAASTAAQRWIQPRSGVSRTLRPVCNVTEHRTLELDDQGSSLRATLKR